MSTPSTPDHRNEEAAQSDEALIQGHTASKGTGASAGSIVSVLFAFLLCFAGVYLERTAGGYDVKSYDEDARSSAGGSAKPKAVDMVAFGKKQYLSACVTCHQPNGLGQPGMYPPLAGSEWVNGSEERVIRIVLHGLSGPVTVAGQQFTGAVQMPNFGKGGSYNWRDDQIAAVLTYVRQEWGNKAPAVTTEKVADIRTKENRSTPWTAEELSKLP
jgi:mono/diheme cytochrome c family protein